jgi:crotonobetainyl-CoA:carnitine CoA-transferase CaiB-like acyl-CoA transferase
VLDDADAYADLHLAERGFFWEITQADTGTYLYPGAPYRLHGRELVARLPPVTLGEHNEYVYKELLGYTDAEYDRLVASGHVGTDYAPDVP